MSLPPKRKVLGAVAGGDCEGAGDGRKALFDQRGVEMDHAPVDPCPGAAEVVDGPGVQDADPLFCEKAKGCTVNRLDLIVTQNPDRIVDTGHLPEPGLRDGLGRACRAALAHNALSDRVVAARRRHQDSEFARRLVALIDRMHDRPRRVGVAGQREATDARCREVGCFEARMQL